MDNETQGAERARYDTAVEAMRRHGLEVSEKRIVGVRPDSPPPFDAATVKLEGTPAELPALVARILATWREAPLGSHFAVQAWEFGGKVYASVELAAYCHDLSGSRCGEEMARG